MDRILDFKVINTIEEVIPRLTGKQKTAEKAMQSG